MGTTGDPRRLLVVGVGNRDRGDDAAGPAVCDLLGARQPDGVVAVVCEGSVLDLAETWDVGDRVIVVDAAEPNGRPGRITETEVADLLLATPGTTSTHAIDVPTAIGLAAAIDRLPASLTVVGIEGERFAHGAAMTSRVSRAVESVAASIILRGSSGV